MDYRELLTKYIRYVGFCEGTDYLDHCAQEHSQRSAGITAEEFTELQRLSGQTDEDAVDEYRDPRCTFCGRVFASQALADEHYAMSQTRGTHDYELKR